MDLFLYWACKFFGFSAFVKAAVVFMIIEIIVNILLVFAGSWFSAIYAIAKIIVLIVFFITGFPVNAVLITFIVMYGIGCLGILADPISGLISILIEILNIIGFVLFRAAFL